MAEWREIGGVWGELDENLKQEMEGVMGAAVVVLSEAKDEAFGEAKRDGSKRRAKRKQPGGSTARKFSRKLMGLTANQVA